VTIGLHLMALLTQDRSHCEWSVWPDSKDDDRPTTNKWHNKSKKLASHHLDLVSTCERSPATGW